MKTKQQVVIEFLDNSNRVIVYDYIGDDVIGDSIEICDQEIAYEKYDVVKSLDVRNEEPNREYNKYEDEYWSDLYIDYDDDD